MSPYSMQSILDKLRPLRWFADKTSSSDDFKCIDWVTLNTQHNWRCLWMLLRHNDSGKCYSFLVRHNELLDTYEDATYAHDFVDVLFAKPNSILHTHAGGRLFFRSDNGFRKSQHWVPLEKDKTTNTLFKLSTDTGDWAVKFYRILTPSNEHEVSVLKALSMQCQAYAVAGTVEYHPAAGDTGPVTTIAVINKFMDGLPAYRLYSRNIKAIFASIASGDQNLISSDKVDALHQLSFSIGEQTAFFHKKINDHFVQGNNQLFNLRGYIQCNRNRWVRVYKAIMNDESLDVEERESLRSYLQQGYGQYLTNNFIKKHYGLPANIFHGDLHLSHIFVDPDDVGKCLLIDPSPRSLDENEKEFLTQSVLQDLKNLHRGLDYFSYDEIVDDLASVMNTSQLQVACQLWRKPREIERMYPAHYSLLSGWSDTVFSGLLEGYMKQQVCIDNLQRSIMRLFYFCRLLKEIEYNYTYDRTFFKYCDYFYLRKFIDQSEIKEQKSFSSVDVFESTYSGV